MLFVIQIYYIQFSLEGQDLVELQARNMVCMAFSLYEIIWLIMQQKTELSSPVCNITGKVYGNQSIYIFRTSNSLYMCARTACQLYWTACDYVTKKVVYNCVWQGIVKQQPMAQAANYPPLPLLITPNFFDFFYNLILFQWWFALVKIELP